MKTTEKILRKLIREEIYSLREKDESVDTGKEIKGSSAVEKVVSKIESNPSIQKALEAIKTPQDLASFLQSAADAATKKGMDQDKLVAAVKKFGQSVLGAKKSKPEDK